MTAVQEPPLTTEEWPAQHERLVEQLRAVRPGLAQEQAHAVLQGLRTLGWAVHPTGQLCPPSTDAPRCCECGSMAVVYRNYQDRHRSVRRDPDLLPAAAHRPAVARQRPHAVAVRRHQRPVAEDQMNTATKQHQPQEGANDDG